MNHSSVPSFPFLPAVPLPSPTGSPWYSSHTVARHKPGTHKGDRLKMFITPKSLSGSFLELSSPTIRPAHQVTGMGLRLGGRQRCRHLAGKVSMFFHGDCLLAIRRVEELAIKHG